MGKFASIIGDKDGTGQFWGKTSAFEGPFDLRFSLNGTNLTSTIFRFHVSPRISLITPHHLEQLNVDVASEFILVVTLMRKIENAAIRPQIDEQGNEMTHAKNLLSNSWILKYKLVRQFAEMQEEIELMKEKRGNLMKELKVLAESSNVEAELQDVDLFVDDCFEKVLKRQEEEKEQTRSPGYPHPYTIEGQTRVSARTSNNRKRVSFVEIVESYKTRIALIFNFLAILDLLAQGMLAIQVEWRLQQFLDHESWRWEGRTSFRNPSI